jgi:hypothetical protein
MEGTRVLGNFNAPPTNQYSTILVKEKKKDAEKFWGGSGGGEQFILTDAFIVDNYLAP